MAQQDREIFFENAANHSIAKIMLLKEYLTIWIRKITYGLKSKCLICDTFAGEGIYSDGTKGSPFVILDVVQDYLNQMPNSYEVYLAFIEADNNNFILLKKNLEEYLKVEIQPNKFVTCGNGKLNVMVSNSKHQDFLEGLQKSVGQLIPSLFFIDPFGFKGVSLQQLTALMNKYNACEVLVNFMYEEFNRFKRIDSIAKTLNDFFGSDVCKLVESVNEMNPKDRRNTIIAEYKKNCKDNKIKYVLDFDIQKDDSAAFKMALIFMSNNSHGFNVMKSAMLKLCKNVEFEYLTCEAKKPSLFSFCEEDWLLDEMKSELFNKFHGQSVTRDEVDKYCREHQFIPDEKVPAILKGLSIEHKVFILKDGGKKVYPKQFRKENAIYFE